MKKILGPAFVISLLTLALDFGFGAKMLDAVTLTEAKKDRIIRQYRKKHALYHHTLRGNFSGLAIWGTRRYKLCTNEVGFKQSCSSPKGYKKVYDIGFIGDSFTEGVGYRYEDTFVGQIAAAKPHLSIANLAVVGYSPSIYLTKIRHLLSQNIRFREVVVFVDISDVQDEVMFQEKGGRIVKLEDEGSLTEQRPLREQVKEYFPLFFHSYQRVKHLLSPRQLLDKGYMQKDYSRSAWTYNPQTPGYGNNGVQGAIQKSLKMMTRLHRLLKRNQIKMSVGVYPWPGQLLYDSLNSRQVQIWKRFCRERCQRFYNVFPAFFAKKPIASIRTYYMKGDFHFNRKGHSLIAKNFLR